jgi:putative transposase
VKIRDGNPFASLTRDSHTDQRRRREIQQPISLQLHLLRNTFRYASKRYCGQIVRDIKPVYSDAWAEMVPFLAFDAEIRKVVCSTNASRSTPGCAVRSSPRPFPQRHRRVEMLVPGHPRSGPAGRGRRRWTNRWKAALNAFDITFNGRVTAGRR